MTRLYLARHGETFFNLENRLGGNPDLTLKGIEHAQKMAEYLKHTEPSIIYVSELLRSRRTGEVIAGHHAGVPVVPNTALNEISNGDMDSLTYEEFEQRFPDLHAERERDKYDWRFPLGESYATARLRAAPFIDGLTEREVIAVGHQGINRVIIGHILGLSPQEIPFLAVPHDVVFELDIENKDVFHYRAGVRRAGYILEENGRADV